MSNYYRFLPKGSSAESFKTVSAATYAYSNYGELVSDDYPLSSTIDIKYYAQGADREKVYALKNTLSRYIFSSQHYSYSSSLGNKETQTLKLVSIPSIFFGSSLDKGSIELDFYVSGTLLAKLQDSKRNGELIQTYGDNGSGSVAGVVLYNEGLIILTGSWTIDSSHTETYIYNSDGTTTTSNPKWIHWGAGLGENVFPKSYQTLSSSFDLKFEGINYINTVTMFAHSGKGEHNFSNNPTFIENSQVSASVPYVNSGSYVENPNLKIKNVKKYAYENHTGTLEKETYISKIGIYDENKNLIAIAKLSKPIKKTENRELTFKLKLDI